jgi:hypothetical protein
MSGKRRNYTPEFREQAARLVIETGRGAVRRYGYCRALAAVASGSLPQSSSTSVSADRPSDCAAEHRENGARLGSWDRHRRAILPDLQGPNIPAPPTEAYSYRPPSAGHFNTRSRPTKGLLRASQGEARSATASGLSGMSLTIWPTERNRSLDYQTPVAPRVCQDELRQVGNPWTGWTKHLAELGIARRNGTA